jgi:sterol desaturase/sphingolipid hydroxylase (fatty acid hydroxylase superfamily)
MYLHFINEYIKYITNLRHRFHQVQNMRIPWNISFQMSFLLLLVNPYPDAGLTIGPMALHSHVVTFWIFLTFELLETTTVHSGYAFLPGISRFIRFHDWHHEFFNGCFGAMGWIDWIHGTYTRYYKTYSKSQDLPRKHRRSRGWLDVE